MSHRPSPANDWEIQREFPPENTDPTYEVGDIFRAYGSTYEQSHPLSWQQSAVIHAISACRTSVLGAHIDQCDHCDQIEISYNSCRNRYCPKCQGRQRWAWVNAQEESLLPIQYFHFVFTLPQAVLPLLRYNETLMYDALMRVAADTLQTFAQRKWAGKLGITMALHTWGQTLNHHPHVHCIVTGGALKNDGREFIRAPKNYLFSIEALSRVFREKYLGSLKAAWVDGQLNAAGPVLADESEWQSWIRPLYQHDWVVYAKQTHDQPSHLIRYLGRYISRVALSNRRLVSIENGRICFHYHDNRDDTEKIMNLSADEFIRRFLVHVLPKGFRRIRYYGWMVNRQRQAKLALCRHLLGLEKPEQPYIADMDALLTRLADSPDTCPRCGLGRLQTIRLIAPHHDPPDASREAA